MDNKGSVMVVSPHPDDAEFGASGTVVQMVRQGREVNYVICTNGDKGTSDRSVKPADLARTRRKEQQEAARVLGVKDVIFLDIADQQLENTAELRKTLVELIRIYRPATMITVDPYTYYFWWHRDHRGCGQAVMDAIFPYARDHLSYPDLLEKGLEPHKVNELLLFNTDKPNYRVDITATFKQKLEALACHYSQINEMGGETEKKIREWSRQLAEGEEYELAETFNRVDMWW
jgi:LmbE family N-acetylglucosaminyl deacetylase